MKITPITKARRAKEVEVVKLVCDCVDGAWLFRVTQVDNQVLMECAECLRDYYFTMALPAPPKTDPTDEVTT